MIEDGIVLMMADTFGIKLMMIAKHAAHYKQVGGAQMIALGSDFDGIDGPHQLENAAFLPLLADALRKEGFTEDEVEGIYYRNAMRFFEENL